MTKSAPGGNPRRIVLRMVSSLAGGGIITAALLFASRSTASSPDELRSVELGLPLAWISQDQSYFNPPSFPYQTGFASPWEHPTMVDLPLLLANVLIIAVVFALVVRAWGYVKLRVGHGQDRPPAARMPAPLLSTKDR